MQGQQIDKSSKNRADANFKKLAERLGLQVVSVPFKVPSLEERRRVYEEFAQVRPLFLKGLYAFYREELTPFMPQKMIESMQMGFAPFGWSVHHLQPRSLDGKNLAPDALEEIKKITSKETVSIEDIENYLLCKDRQQACFAEQKKRFDHVFSNLALVENQKHDKIHSINNWYVDYITKSESCLPNVDVLILKTDKPYIVSKNLREKSLSISDEMKESVFSFAVDEELQEKILQKTGRKPLKNKSKHYKIEKVLEEEKERIDVNKAWEHLTELGLGFQQVDISQRKEEPVHISADESTGIEKAFLSKLAEFGKDILNVFSPKDRKWLRNGSLPAGYAVYCDKFETNGEVGAFSVLRDNKNTKKTMFKIRKTLEFLAENKKAFRSLFQGFFLTDKKTSEEIEAVLNDLEQKTGCKYAVFHKENAVVVLKDVLNGKIGAKNEKKKIAEQQPLTMAAFIEHEKNR
jgi:hypothetical protein